MSFTTGTNYNSALTASGDASASTLVSNRSMQRSHTVGFPVFCVAFTPLSNQFFVSGGGGATKAGVKNTVILYDIAQNNLDVSVVSEHLFSKEDDGCMNVAVHPKEKAFVAAVNRPEDDVRNGNNLNSRVFLIKKSRMQYITSFNTMDSTDPFHHQKVARFSADGKLLCTATTDGKFCIWTWPELMLAFSPIKYETEINDIHIDPSGAYVAIVTPKFLHVVDTAKGKVRININTQKIGAEECEFRAVRFGTKSTKDTIFVVLNAKSRKAAFIQKYSLSEQRIISTNPVSLKPITAFTLSPDGSLVAFGSSDLNVNVMSAKKLKRVARIADAHGFPVTSVDINADNSLVVSGSADGTCMVSTIPRHGKTRNNRQCGFTFPSTMFAIFMLIVAFMAFLGFLGDPNMGEL